MSFESLHYRLILHYLNQLIQPCCWQNCTELLIVHVDKPRHLLYLALSLSIIYPDYVQKLPYSSVRKGCECLGPSYKASIACFLYTRPGNHTWNRRNTRNTRTTYVRFIFNTLGLHILVVALSLMKSLLRFSWTDSTLGTMSLDRVMQAINKSTFRLQELSLWTHTWRVRSERNPWPFLGALLVNICAYVPFENPINILFQLPHVLYLKRCSVNVSTKSSFSPRAF